MVAHSNLSAAHEELQASLSTLHAPLLGTPGEHQHRGRPIDTGPLSQDSTSAFGIRRCCQYAVLQCACQAVRARAEGLERELAAQRAGEARAAAAADALRSDLRSHLLMSENTAAQTTALLADYQVRV